MRVAGEIPMETDADVPIKTLVEPATVGYASDVALTVTAGGLGGIFGAV